VLPAASLRPQIKSGCHGCVKTTRQANHQKSVHPFAQKYSASVVGQISDLNRRVSPDKRGVAHVTKRAVGCGGRDDGWRRTPEVADGEVVWSWRPDAGVKLSGSKLPGVKVARKPGHLGEHEVSRKPLRRESRRCSGSPVVLPPCFLLHGAHGCNRHPAFPAPSPHERDENHARLGHIVPRGRGLASPLLFDN